MKEHFSYGNNERNMLSIVKEDNKYDYGEGVFDDITLENEDSSHAQIIKLVKDNMNVLDVGCANGLLGMLIKKFKKCIIDGIEFDKEASIIASKREEYRNVYNCSILDKEDVLSKISKNQKYDCIIFGDVLEHLSEPWEALITAASLLEKDGQIIVSLPCIDNFDIIRGLINGEFNYNTHGILDSTHIRFFTASSFIEMMENISKQYGIYFDIELCAQTHFSPPYSLNDSFVPFLKDSNGNIKDYFVMQNIFKLTLSKGKKNKIKNFINKKNNYINICDAIEKVTSHNIELENELKELKEKYNELNNKYESIIYSRSWKFINKIRKILRRK